LGSSCGDPLWGAALGNRNNFESSFAQQLRTAALKNRNFKEPQLWGLALERNFGEQLSVATLGSSFRESL